MVSVAMAFALAVVACGGGDDDATTATPSDEAATTTPTHSDNVPAVVPGKPIPVRADGTLDPTQIDLGGVEGVTPEQQARAEDLLRRTIEILPRWTDVEQAKADGFKSIGDALSGEEHYLHWDWINDSVMLDPNQPESLVYKVQGEQRILEAAMFMLPEEYTLDNLPDLGGALTQFHIHDDLCFTDSEAPQVAGLRSIGGTCRPPLVAFNPNVMVHVWIRPNPCGPFAALQGVGAGQIREGETRACDHVHGRLTL
jgi:hypothetical protein